MNSCDWLVGKKLFVFDFDGVIVNSVEAKKSVFIDVFSSVSSEGFQRIEQWLSENEHLPRSRKIMKFTQVGVGNLNKNFAVDVDFAIQQKMETVLTNIKPADGIAELFSMLDRVNVRVAICSAAPEDQILSFISKHNMIFKGELKSSCSNKGSALVKLKGNDSGSSVIFFGDQLSDRLAAAQAGVDFASVSLVNGVEVRYQYTKPSYINLAISTNYQGIMNCVQQG